jgi:hypothetical protein
MYANDLDTLSSNKLRLPHGLHCLENGPFPDKQQKGS